MRGYNNANSTYGAVIMNNNSATFYSIISLLSKEHMIGELRRYNYANNKQMRCDGDVIYTNAFFGILAHIAYIGLLYIDILCFVFKQKKK